MDNKDIDIKEIHIQSSGGFQVIARIETGETSAEFTVTLSRTRRRRRVTKTIEEITEEARGKITVFCQALAARASN